MSTPRIPVFYSFHYENDVFRVQQIRNMGIVDGLPPANANEWVQVTKKGDKAVQGWIDENMKYRRCVVVLIGEKTATRKWVLYEIEKAWKERRGLVGVHIHNLKSMNDGVCSKGPNPFDKVFHNGVPLSSYVGTHDPWAFPSVYESIKSNLTGWISSAVESAKYRQL